MAFDTQSIHVNVENYINTKHDSIGQKPMMNKHSSPVSKTTNTFKNK